MLRIIFYLLASFLSLPLCGAPSLSRPNVILIVADDLGWTDLSCYGSELYETSHLDRLAREGMKFTQAYSACTVCSPTRAAILPGKYPARLHVTDWIPGQMPENPKLHAWRKEVGAQMPSRNPNYDPSKPEHDPATRKRRAANAQ